MESQESGEEEEVVVAGIEAETGGMTGTADGRGAGPGPGAGAGGRRGGRVHPTGACPGAGEGGPGASQGPAHREDDHTHANTRQLRTS